MPQISSGDFRKGVKVIVDGDPYEMLEVNFVKPGKGQALYRTRMRNLLKGTIINPTYRSDDSLEAADIRRSDGIYSYRDGSSYTFMDNETFEQVTLLAEVCEDSMKFLMEGAEVGLMYWNERLIEMSPPQQVVLEITYTEPAARGNTATNVSKPATVETGAEVLVPAFINQGDRIKIDTATGAYIERVRN